MPKSFVKELPQWAEPAIQAISYWMGWNHVRFRHWPLTEGALVAELQRLIAGNIGSDEVLCAEVDVKYLCDPKLTTDDPIRSGRVDIILAKKVKGKRPNDQQLRENAIAIIEVKRAKPWNKIEEDIVRLSRLSSHLGASARSFVIVTSEAEPFGKRFAKNGKALNRTQSLDNAEYRVRRLCRATAALGQSKAPHCACIVEVRATV